MVITTPLAFRPPLPIDPLAESCGSPIAGRHAALPVQADKPKGKMLAAIAYVVKRRDNPDFTWEDALAIKITTTADKVDPDEGDE